MVQHSARKPTAYPYITGEQSFPGQFGRQCPSSPHMRTTQYGLFAHFAVIAAVCAAAMISLSGCSGSSSISEDASPSTAILYSIRSNQPEYDFPGSPDFLDAVTAGIGGQMYIISTDVPQLRVTIDSSLAAAKNDTTRNNLKKKHVDDILSALNSPANGPESDALTALDLASGALATKSGTRTIIIVDNGLTTASPLSLSTTNLLAEGVDPASAIDTLSEAHALPDLDGIHVKWMGLGQTAPPQDELDAAAKSRLRSLWQAVIERSGGTVTFIDSPLKIVDNTTVGSLPPVTPVPVDPLTLAPASTHVDISLSDTQVSFIADTADFVDPGAAEAVIAETARVINEAGATTASVTGCCASWGTPEYQQSLTDRRAHSVAQRLEAYGVAVTTTIGMGTECPGHVNDLDDDGQLIESLAATNRRVIITAN